MIDKNEQQRVRELAEELTLSEVKSENADIQNAIFGLDDIRLEMFPDRDTHWTAARYYRDGSGRCVHFDASSYFE